MNYSDAENWTDAKLKEEFAELERIYLKCKERMKNLNKPAFWMESSIFSSLNFPLSTNSTS